MGIAHPCARGPLSFNAGPTEEGLMAALLYKNHFIIATSQFDQTRELWIPMIDVSWHSATGREFHTMKLSIDFRSKTQAEIFAVEAAETWVDERCKALTH